MLKTSILKFGMIFSTLILVMSTILSFGVSANTIEQNANINEVNPELQKEVDKGLEISPYISSNSDGTINFDSDLAISNGIDESFVKESEEIYNKANQIIISENQQYETGQIQTYASNEGCNGKNYLDGNVFTGTLYINSCNVNSIIAVLAAGGGTSQLAHFIPVAGTYIAVIAGVLTGLGSAALTYNNRAGNGVAIKLARNPISKKIYPYWITSQ